MSVLPCLAICACMQSLPPGMCVCVRVSSDIRACSRSAYMDRTRLSMHMFWYVRLPLHTILYQPMHHCGHVDRTSFLYGVLVRCMQACSGGFGITNVPGGPNGVPVSLNVTNSTFGVREYQHTCVVLKGAWLSPALRCLRNVELAFACCPAIGA